MRDLNPATGAGGVAAPDKAEPRPRVFAPSEEDKERLARVARMLLEPSDDEAEVIDEAEVERLYNEMLAGYEEALKVFETHFAELPSIVRLREMWKAQKIGDEDPVWIIMETMALYDARAQLIFSQVMRVITKSHDLLRVSVGRLERLTRSLGSAVADAAKFEADLVAARAEVKTLREQLTTYGELQPALLEAMAQAKRENETATWRGKLQLMAIGAGIALGAFLLGQVF